MTITVTEVNDAPRRPGTDAATVAEDGVGTVRSASLTGNDSTGPANETSQNLTVTLVPLRCQRDREHRGHDAMSSSPPTLTTTVSNELTYTVHDNGTTNGSPASLCAIATVSITVTEVDDLTVIQSVTAAPTSINENQSTTFTVTLKPGRGCKSNPHMCLHVG